MQSQITVMHKYADLNDPARIKSLVKSIPAPDRDAFERTAMILASLKESHAQRAARAQARIADTLESIRNRPGHHSEYRLLEVDGGVPIEGHDDLLGHYVIGFNHAEVVTPETVELQRYGESTSDPHAGYVYAWFLDGLPKGTIYAWADFFVPGSKAIPEIECLGLGEGIAPAAALKEMAPKVKPPTSQGWYIAPVDMEWQVTGKPQGTQLRLVNHSPGPIAFTGLTLLAHVD